jgi:hypothetical protein
MYRRLGQTVGREAEFLPLFCPQRRKRCQQIRQLQGARLAAMKDGLADIGCQQIQAQDAGGVRTCSQSFEE